MAVWQCIFTLRFLRWVALYRKTCIENSMNGWFSGDSSEVRFWGSWKWTVKNVVVHVQNTTRFYLSLHKSQTYTHLLGPHFTLVWYFSLFDSKFCGVSFAIAVSLEDMFEKQFKPKFTSFPIWMSKSFKKIQIWIYFLMVGFEVFVSFSASVRECSDESSAISINKENRVN